ncbi:MAG: C40 family peptidase [Actinomycetota bacterium]|nr:C40 family peptidase [Actinomycetota bacterium]
MLSRTKMTVLLGLVAMIVTGFAISANAQSTGYASYGTVEVGEAQVGKPFVWGTDGPDTFSCTGLMRYILSTTGIDSDAPWTPEDYLARYTPVAPGDLQPGDIVIYPDWATMYVGNGQLLNANEWQGIVTHTPMEYAGEPVGIVRP